MEPKKNLSTNSIAVLRNSLAHSLSGLMKYRDHLFLLNEKNIDIDYQISELEMRIELADKYYDRRTFKYVRTNTNIGMPSATVNRFKTIPGMPAVAK